MIFSDICDSVIERYIIFLAPRGFYINPSDLAARPQTGNSTIPAGSKYFSREVNIGSSEAAFACSYTIGFSLIFGSAKAALFRSSKI